MGKIKHPKVKLLIKGFLASAMYFLIATKCGPLLVFTLFGIMDNRAIFFGYSVAILVLFLGYMVLFWVLPLRWALSLGGILFVISWLITEKFSINAQIIG